MCRVVGWSLSASVYLSLLCLSGGALGNAETEAVCHASGKKVCVSVEQTSYEKWLWFSTDCNSGCDFYHDSFVNQFFPLEHLSDFNGFGINLRNQSEGRMVLSHYQLGKQSKKQALAVEVEVTQSDRFDNLDGKLFNQALLEDLSRFQPVTPELLKRHYASYSDWTWWWLGHAVTFCAGVAGFFLFIISGCCS